MSPPRLGAQEPVIEALDGEVERNLLYTEREAGIVGYDLRHSAPEVFRVHLHCHLLDLASRSPEDVLGPPIASRLPWLGLFLARVVLVAVLIEIDEFGF